MAASTADAVRLVAEREDGEPWAALGSRAAAALYGCAVLESGVEDPPGSETRFVWIAREAPDPAVAGAWKTALMFWEPADDRAGWLVRCLSEFADRDVNLTRIESRPRRRGLGSYMFFVDLDGRAGRSGRGAGDRCAALPRRGRAGTRVVSSGALARLPPGYGDSRTTRPTGVCAARGPPAART